MAATRGGFRVTKPLRIVQAAFFTRRLRVLFASLQPSEIFSLEQLPQAHCHRQSGRAVSCVDELQRGARQCGGVSRQRCSLCVVYSYCNTLDSQYFYHPTSGY